MPLALSGALDIGRSPLGLYPWASFVGLDVVGEIVIVLYANIGRL